MRDCIELQKPEEKKASPYVMLALYYLVWLQVGAFWDYTPREALIQLQIKSTRSLILCVFLPLSHTHIHTNTHTHTHASTQISTMRKHSQQQPLSRSLTQITSCLLCIDPFRSRPTEDTNWHLANEQEQAPECSEQRHFKIMVESN